MRQNAPIFIGYRRHDSQGFAGRVADDLIDVFGPSQVFRDDDIPEGSNFTHVLEKALANCSVLIAVIGPNWLAIHSDEETPRLYHPDDWVRREIEVALDRGIWILPVLVGNASMPESDDLPDTLVPITSFQAVNMTDRSWEHDLERLKALLIQRIPALDSISHTPQLKKAAESLSNTLESLAQAIATRQSTHRSQHRSLAQSISRPFVRVFWLILALLVAWYVFENHATLEFRQMVFDFLAFTQEKATRLYTWISNQV